MRRRGHRGGLCEGNKTTEILKKEIHSGKIKEEVKEAEATTPDAVQVEEDDWEDITLGEKEQQLGNGTAKDTSPKSQGRKTPLPQKVTGRSRRTKERCYWVKYREGQVKGRLRNKQEGETCQENPKLTKQTRVKSGQDEAGLPTHLKAGGTGDADCEEDRT